VIGLFFLEIVPQTICPGWLRTVILLISASWVARITGVSHWCAAVTSILQKGFENIGRQRLGPWLKRRNTCLASTRPWIQTQYCQKKKKNRPRLCKINHTTMGNWKYE
jgi:hypothetical protein